MPTELLEPPQQIQTEEETTIVAPVVTPPEEIQATTQTLKHNYDKVFEDGTLISLHVRCWGMASQLDEDDLGVQKQPSIFKLGKKMLIKPEIAGAFKRCESKGRHVLTRAGLDFPVAEAHFVPRCRLNKVIEDLLIVQTEWNKLCEDFFANYETHKEDVLTSFPEQRSKLEPCYPSLETIKQKFSFYWIQFRVAFPKELAEYDLNAKIAEEKAVTEVERVAQQRLREQAESQARMLENFVQENGEILRRKILEGCQKVADKIVKKQAITQTSINGLLKQVTEFKELNFLDDQAVAKRLEELQALIQGGAEDFKDSPATTEKLEATLNQIIQETSRIGDVEELTGRYFRTVQLDNTEE